MKKLLTLIATMIICNAYGDETVYWATSYSGYTTSTCTTGGNITKPTNPTKSGYRFIGWREATFDEYPFGSNTFKGIGGQTWSPMDRDGSTTWSVTFPYATISGIIRCSSTKGTTKGETGNPSTSSGNYCWCKMTKLNSKDVSSAAWVYSDNYSNPCSPGCAYTCGIYASSTAGQNPDLRKALFTKSN